MNNERETLVPGTEVGSFQIVKLIGRGGYGDTYSVRRTGTDELYAMKVEQVSAEKRSLAEEKKFIEMIQDSKRFPRLIEYGHTTTHTYLVMELLGPSVSNTRRRMPGRHYTISTVLRLSVYMVECIRDFHLHGLVHRDIKPGNFLLRNGGDCPLVLIDFGLSGRYIDPVTGKPFAEKKHCGFRGTTKYASLPVHKRYSQGPRDDLLSWLYSIVELIDGCLPWGTEENEKVVKAEKENTPGRTLLRSLPSEFVDIYHYLQGLTYLSRVNYDHIICLIDKAILRTDALGEPFDWEFLRPETVLELSSIPQLPKAADYAGSFPVIRAVEDEPEIELDDCRCNVN